MALDILKSYPWISKEFLSNNVRKCESNNDVTVKSFNVENALGKGENYSSNMIRIAVNYFLNSQKEEKKISFVLKAAIPNRDLDIISNVLQIFPKEIKVYNTIMPEVENLLKSIGDNTQLSPRCYGVDTALGYLLFEDLRTKGFANVNKSVGLDFEHLKLTLTNLAKWHATTAVLGVKDPSIISVHTKPIPRKEVPGMDAVVKNIVRATSQVSKKWHGFEEISQKLADVEKKIAAKAYSDHEQNGSDFNVITHGDLWSNNIMYKYDDNNRVSNVLFVDFAMGTWSVPTRDLVYLFFSSSDSSVRDYEWDKLIQHYHYELSSLLKKLNYPKRIPTLSDIQVSFIKSFAYDTLMGVLITAIRYIKRTQGDGFLALVSEKEIDEKYRIELFSNPECEGQLKFLLNYLDRKGFLDM